MCDINDGCMYIVRQTDNGWLDSWPIEVWDNEQGAKDSVDRLVSHYSSTRNHLEYDIVEIYLNVECINIYS